MIALTDEIQEVGGSTRRRSSMIEISLGVPKKDDLELEWQEKKSELNELVESDKFWLSEWRYAGRLELSEYVGMWEKELCTEFFHLYWANEEI